MIEDPLKSLHEIVEPDQRSLMFVGTLADIHTELSQYRLIDEVPREVVQLFETAKNLSLYSWFVYRFHQVAESLAFQALELGMRLRCENDSQFNRNQRPNLRVYLNHAASAGWLHDSRFSNLRQIARHRARMRATMKAFADGLAADRAVIAEPTEADIDSELSTLKYVEGLLKAIPRHRNELAHGSPMVAPTSRKVLRVVEEILNQVYASSSGSVS